MPPEMAQRLSEGVKKKPESPGEKLQKALDEIARDIAMIEQNPQDWGGWVNYLMLQLEVEAQRREKLADFEEMLESLKNRLGS